MPSENLEAKAMKAFCVFFFLTQAVYCQDSTLLGRSFLEKKLKSSIQYLKDTQTQETKPGQYYKGEWPSIMDLTASYFFIGKKQKARDSNCFSVAAIHNLLAEIYLSDSSHSEILPMLSLAYQDIETYKTRHKFNFWKALPPKRDLRLGPEPKVVPLVRRPTNYFLKSRFISNASNIPEDADDTALGNLATFYHNQIFNKSSTYASATVFDQYLDQDRNNRNWFNVLFHRDPNSGAYMTWLHPEHDYGEYNLASLALNTIFIFVPGSTAHPKPYKPWIPFRTNDIDAAVNANVLSFLAKSNQTTSSHGASASIEMLNNRLQKNKWYNNSIYYPNQYFIDYSIAKSYSLGIKQLEPSVLKIIEHLESSQDISGAYKSMSYINDFDKIQSTAYALHAMLDLKKAGKDISRKQIDKALVFLLKQAEYSEKNICWDGGVFFSGGTVIRNLLFWKSDAYTTALIASCIQKYLKLDTESK